jgi:hypothetical protein
LLLSIIAISFDERNLGLILLTNRQACVSLETKKSGVFIDMIKINLRQFFYYFYFTFTEP